MKTHRIVTPLLALLMLFSSATFAIQTQGVLVSIKPLHALVSGVIGQTGKAGLLLADNTSPHEFNLRPSQVRAMQKANLIFYIDDSFETFLHRVFKTLPKRVKKVAIVDKSALPILAFRQGGAWDEHKHEEHTSDGHDSHSEHHHDDAGNMHVWLDPANASRMIKAITKVLSSYYPENRNLYKANARAMIRKIAALDAELKTTLAGLQDKPFIVFHDAYQYFERAYGLRAVGSITFEPDEFPSPKRISQVKAKLQQTRAKCIFREPQFSDRLINTVAEGAQVEIGTLDPLGAGLDNGEALYFALMRNLASNLKACLAASY